MSRYKLLLMLFFKELVVFHKILGMNGKVIFNFYQPGQEFLVLVMLN
jgi:hypothetical protein